MSTTILSNSSARIGTNAFTWDSDRSPNGLSATFQVPGGEPEYRVPLGKLLRLEPASPELADNDFWYKAARQSWQLVHRGVIAEPELGQRFDAYFEAREKMQGVDEALHQAFASDVATLDSEMVAYEKHHSVDSRIFPLSPPTHSSKLTPSRLLFEGDALVMLARALLDGGIDAQQLAPLIERAALVSGDTAGVRALRMRLAVRGHDDATFANLFSKVDGKFLPPGFGREAGLALVERLFGAFPSVSAASAVDLQGLRERAFTLLEPVAAANPADVEAAWGYALLAADLKRDLPKAQATISAARERLPRSPDLALAVARVDEVLGDHKAALKDLVSVFRFSRDAELRAWAAKRIDEFATPTP